MIEILLKLIDEGFTKEKLSIKIFTDYVEITVKGEMVRVNKGDLAKVLALLD